MIDVAGHGTLQLVDSLLDRDVIRRREVRVHGVARRDAITIGPPKYGLGQEETLDPVPRQIEPVDRAVKARRKVAANLSKRPSAHGAVADPESVDFGYDLPQVVEAQRAPWVIPDRGQVSHYSAQALRRLTAERLCRDSEARSPACCTGGHGAGVYPSSPEPTPYAKF